MNREYQNIQLVKKKHRVNHQVLGPKDQNTWIWNKKYNQDYLYVYTFKNAMWYPHPLVHGRKGRAFCLVDPKDLKINTSCSTFSLYYYNASVAPSSSSTSILPSPSPSHSPIAESAAVAAPVAAVVAAASTTTPPLPTTQSTPSTGKVDNTLVPFSHSIQNDLKYRLIHKFKIEDDIIQRLIKELTKETINAVPLIELAVESLQLIPVNQNTELLKVIEEAIQQLPQTESATTTTILQKLKQHKESIKETFYGSTKTWAVRAKANEKQKICRSCGAGFSKTAERCAVSCDYCRIEINQCHPEEAVPVLQYLTSFICPHCTTKKEWQISPEEVQRQLLQPTRIINRTTGKNGDIKEGYTYFVVTPKKYTNQIFIENAFVTQRICCMETKIAINTIKNYQPLLQQFLYKIPTNCYYEQEPQGLNVKRGFDYYFNTLGPMFGSKFTRETLGFEEPTENVDFWLSHFAAGRFNAFLGFGNIIEQLRGAAAKAELLKDISCNDFLSLQQDPLQVQLIQQKCESTFLSKTSRGFSLTVAYKSEKTCQKGVVNDDVKVQSQFLQKKGKEGSNLELYYDKENIEKLREIIKEILDLKQRMSSSSSTAPSKRDEKQKKKQRKKLKSWRKREKD